jgi:putative pyruvate formate lyase activating enzyme
MSPSGSPSWPAYLALHRSGELLRRAEQAVAQLTDCRMCPNQCGADRLNGSSRTLCRVGRQAFVHSHAVHRGGEACLAGTGGSGTIFFSGCNMRCLYCQNWEIAVQGEGEPVSAEVLAGMMLSLQEQGCHNINLVSPTHVAAHILEALPIAAERGLRLPLVWNSGGYDSVETLLLFDGVVDIYLPDLKYGDSRTARLFSSVHNYVEASHAALREMHRQVGDLDVGPDGLARRGLLVRHLVLPDGLSGTEAVFAFLADEISPKVALNIMGLYQPFGRARQHPSLRQAIPQDQVEAAVRAARAVGLKPM